MTIKKFLVSVMDAYIFDENDVLLASAKTLIDSSLDVKLSATDVRGGRGNQLQYVYYHSNEMNITLNDTQWNLDFLAATAGVSPVTNNNVYTEETITLGAAGTGTILGTPLAIQGTSLYGWVTQNDGSIERVTFSTKTFATSTGTSGDVVCVRYFAADAASRSITINANMIPKVCRIVLEGSLNSSDQSSNKIGVVQVIIPKAVLSGAFTLNLKSDGTSQTPLTARALAYSDTASSACTSAPVYAKIIEILDSAYWYSECVALAIEGGDFSLTHPSTTHQLVVYAIKSNGDAAFIPPYGGQLTFSSATVGKATIDAATGIVSTVATGTTVLSVVIAGKTSIEASCLLTVA